MFIVGPTDSGGVNEERPLDQRIINDPSRQELVNRKTVQEVLLNANLILLNMYHFFKCFSGKLMTF